MPSWALVGAKGELVATVRAQDVREARDLFAGAALAGARVTSVARWATLDHAWFWRAKLPERKGHRCRVLVRGGMNSVLVQFSDGYRVVTSRHAVRPL